YHRHLRWRSPKGATLEIDAERVVPLDQSGLLAIRYLVRSIDYRGPLTLHSALEVARHATAQGDDPRIGTRVSGGLAQEASGNQDDMAWLTQSTTNSAIRLACGQRHRTGMRPGAMETSPEGIMQAFHAEIEPGQEVVLEKFVAYAWTRPGQDTPHTQLLETVADQLQHGHANGYASLAREQSSTLSRFWDGVDLAIDGDPATEQALRLNLFHVFQSTCRDGSGSAAAKGLTGEGYEGHYFWDAEIFMLPAMLATQPELARSMLEYRYSILDAARRHAREMNHARGALFAWRTISGDECSAYFPSGSAQYHINAAVAWALRLYVDATGDLDFLRDKGAEILFETARVWLDTGHFDARRDGAFCIPAVTGPDEYTALIDNNHYTNRMAQRHLRDAAEVATWMATRHPQAYAALVARIGLHAEEPLAWQRAADAMYLPQDAATGVFPQDDTFLDKPRLPALKEDGTKQPLLLRMHPLTLYRHQVCKQADVVLALVLAGADVDMAAKRRNLEYYEAVTVHDSTLSASTFAVLSAEIGDSERAWHYFMDALRVDLDDLHGNAAHGVHLAAMAGSWQALAWGFGGLRMTQGRLDFAPQLPRNWQGYRFGVRWQNQRVRVSVRRDQVEYTLVEGDSLDIRHCGQLLQLRAGSPVTRPTPRVEAPKEALKAVIFDLDGVIADTAVLHEAAWRRLAEEIGMPFDDAIGERLKGVDRLGSLEILLEQAPRAYTQDEKQALAERKNGYYREMIEQVSPADLLPGARQAIASTREAGLRVGLASASRNAPLLLERLGIAGLFDYIVDAGAITNSKPDPEIFLTAARGLGVDPEQCLGVEDAAAGIASIQSAGMEAVGIGNAHALADADVLLPDVAAFDISRFTTHTAY
ncbi:beta-phosphoglucomutase, partial [Oleiagrimonas sp.]|uniref:beta-phosphoglucomutase n=1 Tax=Oleiagrimonas sp. TaxID=2010330 RepID=UPI002639AC00